MDAFDYRLKNKLQEVFYLPPNEVGPSFVTRWFKQVTRYLKIMPFIYIVPLSFFAAAAAYVVLGPLIIKLVSLLQYGF